MFHHSTKYSIFLTLPLLLLMAYLLYKYLGNTLYFGPLDTVNFAIHEMGHLFFHFFGNQFLTVAGGTLMQILIPLIMMGQFLFQRDTFGIALCFAWLGSNFFYIATYAGDAVQGNLMLVNLSGQGEVIHDWSYMLIELGVIDYTPQIALGFRIIAVLCFLFFFFYGGLQVVNRLKGGKI